MRRNEAHFAGALLGTMVGDAIGLPREGLSAPQARRWFGGQPIRHRLVFGFGLCSDDAEHAWMTAQALLASGGDAVAFQRSLAWRLRWWLLGLPAGIGWATLRAIVKLWLGFPAGRNGVWSAGNGPAMRAAVIGLFASDDAHLATLVAASTRLTHTDPRAEAGAMAVAVAARYGATTGAAGVTVEGFLSVADERLPEGELRSLLQRLHGNDTSLADYAAAIGVGPTGVSGYVNQTVPVALAAWLYHPGDVRSAVESVVLLGGDTDTTGAIAGALAGATAGAASIPVDWLDGIIEWPRTIGKARLLAHRLAERGRPIRLFWPGIIARNGVFTVIVVCHVLARLLLRVTSLLPARR